MPQPTLPAAAIGLPVTIDKLEMPVGDLATASEMPADLVCSLGTSPKLDEQAFARALWIANRVRDDANALWSTVINAIEERPQSSAGRIAR